MYCGTVANLGDLAPHPYSGKISGYSPWSVPLGSLQPQHHGVDSSVTVVFFGGGGYMYSGKPV